MFDQTVLQQKLATLEAFPDIQADTVRTFGDALTTLDDWDLLRVNPLAFAEKVGLDAHEAIDLFVHSAKVGLFDFTWHLVCPGCGLSEYRYDSVNDLTTTHFHCTVCQMDRPATMDRQVEVGFTINPTIKKLEIDPFADQHSYSRYHFSPNVVDSWVAQQFRQAVRSSFHPLEPDGSITITFTSEPGKQYRVMSLDLHTITSMMLLEQVSNEPASALQQVAVDIVPTGFVPSDVGLQPGEVQLRMRNLRKQTTGVLFAAIAVDLLPPEDAVSAFRPFLTGKMLLNNQSFRDLFRVQELRSNLRLEIRNLTLLFTDLKGSTDLYDRAGDAFAYDLIQEHFQVLGSAVRRNSGAIIKTMGDAVMASFSTPQEAVQASLEMMDGMRALNDRLTEQGYALGLKVGLHEGAALAVNAEDRLDYFGQTVNIAARVQGLAGSNEIWMTEPVFTAPMIADLLKQHGYCEEQRSVLLKGVREATTVYRLSC